MINFPWFDRLPC